MPISQIVLIATEPNVQMTMIVISMIENRILMITMMISQPLSQSLCPPAKSPQCATCEDDDYDDYGDYGDVFRPNSDSPAK